MNGERDPRDEVEPDLRRALEHARRPVARPEFRAELGRRFLDGAARAPVDRPRRRLALVVAAVSVAAAVVVALFLTRERAPTWRVHPASTVATVVVDGVAIPIADGARLVDALGTAREVEVRGGTLRVGVRDEAWIELGDGTRLSQMRFPAAGAYQARADSGSLRVATLPKFGGRGMRVLTADFDLQVVGTTFGVDVDARGSCLCTLDGTVECKPVGEKAMRAVGGGAMCFARHDGGAPTWGTAHEAHLGPLRSLRE